MILNHCQLTAKQMCNLQQEQQCWEGLGGDLALL